MGAGQSNATGGQSARASAETQELKTSYYELLEIEKQATDEDIKKAYRRKALELHPDRNYGDVERTTALFAEVQTAYSVLSDPQERAWYDAHEDAILRNIDPEDLAAGGNADTPDAYERAVGLTTADDITRMLRRFNAGIDFSDAPTGFFGFLRETFERLAKEEDIAARRESSVAPVDYPGFGHAEDDYDDVVRSFYAVWAGFATRKTFSWRDRWRASDAPDRRTRRVAEKENARLREEGIREFNDAVRTLVAFVKKRDPRCKVDVRTEVEREKALRDAAAARAAKMRRENEAKVEDGFVPEWAKSREQDADGDDALEGTVGEEEESEEEQFECVACRKTFKSERQFEAHEKSKKHQKAVAALRKRLKKEGVELELDETEDEDEDSIKASGATTPAVDHVPIATNGAHNGHPKAEHDQEEQWLRDDINGHVAHAVQASMEDLNLQSDGHASKTDDGDDDDDISDSKSTATSPKPADTSPDQIGTPATNTSTLSSPDDDSASDSSMPPTRPQPSQPKQGKAAQKRAKKAAAASSTSQQSEDLQHRCASCAAAFASRTRLFQHIKDHGHAAPVPAGKKAKGGKKR